MRAVLGLCMLVLAGCEIPPPDPERVAQECEERARAAQGLTGRVGAGVNSDSGPFTNVVIGVTSDFVLGRDPNAVYSECVQRRTGAAPIRAPNLR